jgi:hypothetical protein
MVDDDRNLDLYHTEDEVAEKTLTTLQTKGVSLPETLYQTVLWKNSLVEKSKISVPDWRKKIRLQLLEKVSTYKGKRVNQLDSKKLDQGLLDYEFHPWPAGIKFQQNWTVKECSLIEKSIDLIKVRQRTSNLTPPTPPQAEDTHSTPSQAEDAHSTPSQAEDAHSTPPLTTE